jgi:hypothetical protein
MADNRLLREGNPTPYTTAGFVPQHVLIDGVTYVKTGEGNPLPTKLTGSNVEIIAMRNMSVSAGSSVNTGFQGLGDFRKAYAYGATDAAHTFSINFQLRDTSMTSGIPSYAEDPDKHIISSGGIRVASTGQIDVAAPEVILHLTNEDTVSHIYDMVIGGIL